MTKAILSFAFAASVFISCSKSSSDKEPSGAGTVNGFWKGNTPTYGVGVLIRQNGTAREYFYTGGMTMPDTSGSDVYKAEGTYTITGNNISINCANSTAGYQLNGTMNSGFTSMEGTSVFSSAIIVTQSFSMTK